MNEDLKSQIDELLELYYEGRDMTDAFIVRYEELVDDKFDKAFFPATPIRGAGDAKRVLGKAYDAFKALSDDVRKSCDDWTNTVSGILKITPTLLLQFDEPDELGYLYGRGKYKNIPPQVENIECKISITQMRVLELKKIIGELGKNHEQPKPQPICIRSVKFERRGKPTVIINKKEIVLDSSSVKMASAIEAIFGKKRDLTKSFTAVQVYKWQNNTEKWENIGKFEQKQFRDNLYQHIRQLNIKAGRAITGEKDLLIKVNRYGYSVNPELLPPKS